jgi:hypothetical protein
MSAFNWKSEIVRLAMVKQSIAAADQAKALPWALPNVAAEEADLAQAEKAISQPLAGEYRDFLGYANGWTGFCVLTDLFGTKELASERAQAARVRPDLLTYCQENKLDASACVVIGDSPNDLNMFVMFQEQPESVVWLCGEEVDKYNSFSDFFLAMISYNEQVLRRLTKAS